MEKEIPYTRFSKSSLTVCLNLTEVHCDTSHEFGYCYTYYSTELNEAAQQTYHGVVSGDFVEICLMINKVSAVRKPFLEIFKAEDILSFRI